MVHWHIVGPLLIAFDLGFPCGLLLYRVLFIVVVFIEFCSMVPLFVLSAFSVLFHTFFYLALLNGFVLFHILYGYFLLTVLFWV